jgi:hypothetical protein
MNMIAITITQINKQPVAQQIIKHNSNIAKIGEFAGGFIDGFGHAYFEVILNL